MRYLPISLNLDKKQVLFAGGNKDASAKVRLLAKTKAHITVLAPSLNADLQHYHQQGRITWQQATINAENLMPFLQDCTLFYAATGDKMLDATLANNAQSHAKLINAVDQQQCSDFITPALVNHSPLTIAISTEGAAPVLARILKAKIESLLPKHIGRLTKLAGNLRPAVDTHLQHGQKRHFWQWFFTQNIHHGKTAPVNAEKLLQDFKQSANIKGGFYYLPLENIADKNALAKLRDADIIYFSDDDANLNPHPDLPELIDMARREAEFFPHQLPHIDAIKQAKKHGHHLLVLAPYKHLAHLIDLSEQANLPLHYQGKNTQFTLTINDETQLQLLNWAMLQTSNHMVEIHLPRHLFPQLQAKLLQYDINIPLYIIADNQLSANQSITCHHAPANAQVILLDCTQNQHQQSHHASKFAQELAHAQNYR